MAFIPVPNVAEAVMVYSLDSQRVVNTLYFEFATPPDVSDLNLLAAELETWQQGYQRGLVPNAVILNEVQCTDLTTESGPGIVYTTGLPAPGVGGTVALPNNVTLAVTFLTELRGRSYRGRNYYIQLAESEVTANTVTALKITEITDMYEALMDPGTISVPTWVVVSRYTDGAPRTTGVATPITGVRVNPTIDSQRRRLPGRGS